MNNICYFNLTTYSTTGGIENFNKSFLKVLDSFNKKTISVSVYDNNHSNCFENIDFKNFNKNKLKASIYLLKNIYNFQKLIVAHINLLPIAILAKILNPKVKIYLSIYGIEVWKKLPFIYRSFLKNIDILSISTYTTNMFLEYNKLGNKKIYYLPPDSTFRNEKKFENIYNSNNFNLLSVTRLDSNDNYKGIDSIIKAIPSLVKQIPNIKYTIIGKGDDKQRLEKLVKTLKIEKFVEFKGFVEFIEPYYQFCNLFVLPSKGEGFGIVYLEAMKHKKACIACNIGGQTDVVLDNKTGYLCEYNNIECLSSKIINLYENPLLLKEFGENGYEHFLNNFTFDKFKTRLENILNAG